MGLRGWRLLAVEGFNAPAVGLARRGAVGLLCAWERRSSTFGRTTDDDSGRVAREEAWQPTDGAEACFERTEEEEGNIGKKKNIVVVGEGEFDCFFFLLK